MIKSPSSWSKVALSGLSAALVVAATAPAHAQSSRDASAHSSTVSLVAPASTAGSVALGTVSVRTRGEWLAPRDSACVNLLLDYRGVANNPEVMYYGITVQTHTGDFYASGSIIPMEGAPADGTTSIIACGNPEDPLDSSRPITLRLTEFRFHDEPSDATGTPFFWSTSPVTPPAPTSLPGTAQLRGVTISTTGNWLRPRSQPPLSTYLKPGYSYLLNFAGLRSEESVEVSLIDPRTRQQLAFGAATGSEFASEPATGQIGLVIYPDQEAAASFVMQVRLSAGDVVEHGPIAWAAQPPPNPVPQIGPQPVSLGSLVATPVGDWSVPARCGRVTVAYTGRPNDWQMLFVRLIDEVTREELGQGSMFDYLESASIDMNVCARVTAQTRLILQVESRPGVAESVPFRWEGAVVVPQQVRNLKAVVPKAKGRVNLSWQPPINAVQAGVTAYQYRVNNSTWRTVAETSVSVIRLSNKKSITFTVRAIAGDTLGAETKVSAKPR